MIIQKKQIAQKTLKIIQTIGKFADQKEINAFLVGGIVRDILLKRHNLDIDILIDKGISSFPREIADFYKSKVVFHKKFRTASIVLSPSLRLDFSAFRSETYAQPGALPTVKKGTLQEDIFRRDFTINSLVMSINHRNFGEIIDPYKGYADLQKGIIRVFHPRSFEDDPTRILRAIRFEQRFRFRIEPKTETLLKKSLKSGFVNKVTPQRYFSEFKKILSEEDPVPALKRLKGLGGLAFLDVSISADLSLVRRVHKNICALHHKPLFGKEVKLWLIYFLALIHPQPLSANKTERSITRFGLSNEEKKTILQLTEFSDMIGFLDQANLKPSEITERLLPLTSEALCFLFVASKRKNVLKNIQLFLRKYRLVNLKVTGEDLKKIGIPQGKVMGETKQLLLQSKLDKGLNTKSQELKEVKKIIERR